MSSTRGFLHLRERRTNEAVGRRMDFSSDAKTNSEGLLPRRSEKEMPDATLVVFEGDDHFAYFHQPDRFCRVLDAFLRRDYE